MAKGHSPPRSRGGLNDRHEKHSEVSMVVLALFEVSRMDSSHKKKKKRVERNSDPPIEEWQRGEKSP